MTSHPSAKGNFVVQAKCLTSDENSASTPALGPDLLASLQSKRLSLAQSVDLD